jgi:hypothetical protein
VYSINFGEYMDAEYPDELSGRTVIGPSFDSEEEAAEAVRILDALKAAPARLRRWLKIDALPPVVLVTADFVTTDEVEKGLVAVA